MPANHTREKTEGDADAVSILREAAASTEASVLPLVVKFVEFFGYDPLRSSCELAECLKNCFRSLADMIESERESTFEARSPSAHYIMKAWAEHIGRPMRDQECIGDYLRRQCYFKPLDEFGEPLQPNEAMFSKTLDAEGLVTEIRYMGKRDPEDPESSQESSVVLVIEPTDGSDPVLERLDEGESISRFAVPILLGDGSVAEKGVRVFERDTDRAHVVARIERDPERGVIIHFEDGKSLPARDVVRVREETMEKIEADIELETDDYCAKFGIDGGKSRSSRERAVRKHLIERRSELFVSWWELGRYSCPPVS